MLRTPVFKFLQIGAVALLVLALTLGSAGAQPAQAATTRQVSAGWMPFSGSLPDSNISLNGSVHIVARWQSVSDSQVQVDIEANLPAAGVTVTTDTGIPYSAFGAGQSSILFPNDPVFPNDPLRVVVPSFRLQPSGPPILPPNPIQPFGLQFDLVFSAAGVLDFTGSTVQVVELPDVGED